MIEVRTPSRLHFGLLAYSRASARQFGGVGLMVRQPAMVLRMQPSDRVEAVGPMADRAAAFAEHAMRTCDSMGLGELAQAVAIEVAAMPRAHAGFGTGTQLGMSVARGMAELAGRSDLSARQLAMLVDRGRRSAVGAHGFVTGGLIVEGGKRRGEQLSPRLMRYEFPSSWRLIVVVPSKLHATMAGAREIKAFAELSPIPVAVTAEMCRLVLLGLIPSLLERDLGGFSENLFTLQQTVGQCFADAQGGIYADPLLTRIVNHLRARGVNGVGQSSWGPTLYAVCEQADAGAIAADLRQTFGLTHEEVSVTSADNQGCHVEPVNESAGAWGNLESS